MNEQTPASTLDFGVLPLAAASALLRRVMSALTLAVLAQEPLPPLATLLRPGEDRLLAPTAQRDLARHRRAAGLRRAPRPWPWGARAQPSTLRQIGLNWRYGRRSARESHVQVLEHVELGYRGLTAEHLPPQFWPLAGIRAWQDLEFQYELACAVRATLRPRVLFTAAEIRALHPDVGGLEPFAPELFWLLLAAADTCPSGVLWRRSQRRLRLAAARLQEIADNLARAEHWAGFWEQWLLLELARQDKTWFGNLSPQLQSAAGSLPIFAAAPDANPCPPAAGGAPAPHLARAQTAWPAWFQRLYPQGGEQQEQQQEQQTDQQKEQPAKQANDKAAANGNQQRN